MAGIAQKIIADPDSFSIDMLTQGVQDGTVPAYIGVPLIQEKMQAQKEQEALMGGMQQEGEPPIAHQILGEAAQTNGVEALPTGLPTEGFAPGGIVAFAEGGEADDDEEEDDGFGMSDDEQKLFSALRNRLASSREFEEMEGIGALPIGAAKTAVKETKREVSSKVGNEPKQTKSEGITQLYKENTPSEDAGISKLTKEGTPAGDLINKIMMKESGGRRYDKNGNLLEGPQTKYGTAKGEMQVMDATARDPGYGIRPARPNDPDDLARVGREYFGKMMDKYGDPKIAAIAYNWGPGNTDKWLAAGADMSKLPKETYNYSRNMAAGGRVVPGFAGGVYMDPMGGVVPGDEPEYTGSPLKLGEAIQNWSMGQGFSNTEDILRRQEEKKKKEAIKKAKPIITDADNAAAAAETEKLKRLASTAAEARADQEAPVAPTPEAPAETNPMGDYLGEYAAYLKDRRGQMAADKEQNKYLALLQAGLGMMGGTSRYAGANIGQGASQGIAAYMAGQKQASADDRALQQGMLGLTRADLYNKMHSEDIARRKEAGIKGEESKYASQIVSLENAAERNAVSLIGQDKLGAMDPAAARAQVEAEKARILKGSKLYRDLHKRLKLGDPFEGMDNGAKSGNTERVWSDLGKKK
jgi:hypothetical protein